MAGALAVRRAADRSPIVLIEKVLQRRMAVAWSCNVPRLDAVQVHACPPNDSL